MGESWDYPMLQRDQVGQRLHYCLLFKDSLHWIHHLTAASTRLPMAISVVEWSKKGGEIVRLFNTSNAGKEKLIAKINQQ